MAIDKDLFGPQSDEEKEVFALESLVFSVQVALQRAMNKHGVTNKMLAERLGMSPARVSQIFSNQGPNLTLKTIAKIQTALGEDFELVSKDDRQITKGKSTAKSFSPVAIFTGKSAWREVTPVNANRRAEAVAA